jgi:hypothetical protein
MPRRSIPSEQSLVASAGHKIKAAERREAQAARLRTEAAELQRRWREYLAERDATKREQAAS